MRSDSGRSSSEGKGEKKERRKASALLSEAAARLGHPSGNASDIPALAPSPPGKPGKEAKGFVKHKSCCQKAVDELDRVQEELAASKKALEATGSREREITMLKGQLAVAKKLAEEIVMDTKQQGKSLRALQVEREAWASEELSLSQEIEMLKSRLAGEGALQRDQLAEPRKVTEVPRPVAAENFVDQQQEELSVPKAELTELQNPAVPRAEDKDEEIDGQLKIGTTPFEQKLKEAFDKIDTDGNGTPDYSVKPESSFQY